MCLTYDKGDGRVGQGRVGSPERPQGRGGPSEGTTGFHPEESQRFGSHEGDENSDGPLDGPGPSTLTLNVPVLVGPTGCHGSGLSTSTYYLLSLSVSGTRFSKNSIDE